MADTKLPSGYFESTGELIEVVDNETKEVLRTVTHPKGVIVGPHEAKYEKEVTLVCPRCKQRIKSKSGIGACAGENIQVIPALAKVIDGKIVFLTDEVYGIEKGDVFREDVYDEYGQSQWTHGSKRLVEGYELEQNAVIQSRETHGKTTMEVAK